MIEIAARRWIKPYRQGELDFLCGIYATINAIRLLHEDFSPMNLDESTNLFIEGTQYLKNLHKALTWGMKPTVHYDLTKHLTNIVSAKKTFSIEVERAELPEPTSVEAIFAWIDESLREGKPVLTFFEDEPDHYTVIAGSTASRLLLFDSNGESDVPKADCGEGRDDRRIAPNSLIRLAVEQSD